jgi:hypothetical protein
METEILEDLGKSVRVYHLAGVENWARKAVDEIDG